MIHVLPDCLAGILTEVIELRNGAHQRSARTWSARTRVHARVTGARERETRTLLRGPRRGATPARAALAVASDTADTYGAILHGRRSLAPPGTALLAITTNPLL